MLIYDGKFNNYDVNEYSRQDFLETTNNMASQSDLDNIKKFENSSINNCLYECNKDEECQKFMFEKNNNRDSHLGECLIIHNDTLSDKTAYEDSGS